MTVIVIKPRVLWDFIPIKKRKTFPLESEQNIFGHPQKNPKPGTEKHQMEGNFEAIKAFRAAGVEAVLVWGNRQHVAQTSQFRLPWEQMNSICYGKRHSGYNLGTNLCFTSPNAGPTVPLVDRRSGDITSRTPPHPHTEGGARKALN